MNSYLLRLWYAPGEAALLVDEFTQRADSPEDAADKVAKSVGITQRAWGIIMDGDPVASAGRVMWAIEVEP